VDYQTGKILPDGIVLSPTLTLAPGTAGLVDDYYQILRSVPDQVRVTVWARDLSGNRVSGVTAIPVRTHEARNTYVFPLEPGEWFVLAFPGLHGHHRWTAATEHGYDITMVDSRGSWARGNVADWRTGSVPRWEDWYAYNKKVLAAADGVVVKVVADVEFPLEFWNRQDGESLEGYRERIGKKQMELFMEPGADPAAVAGGNHIVIRHAGDEYSFYAHLAYGSIRVEEGQEVAQGEHIAGLGGTGEEPAVHLHFQVSDGPSMLTSRTLPVEFSDVHVNEQFSDLFEPKLVFQPGFFVTSAGLED
jgi:murein DD-endopeptidase MepM/ murein hydrolase activator NlpD